MPATSASSQKVASVKTNDTLTAGDSTLSFRPLMLPETRPRGRGERRPKEGRRQARRSPAPRHREDKTFRYLFNAETKKRSSPAWASST
jgi:elongation factor G